eukprot:gene47170-57771_t
MSAFGRPWWDNEVYKNELMARVSCNNWYVVDKTRRIAGKVMMICYSGYKVQFLTNAEVLNPDVLTDITAEECSELQRLERAHAEEQARIAEETKNMKKFDIFFDLCPHERVKEEQTCRAAGCDIYDTTCLRCEKLLRRSWSTAYDRDPDDLITDWKWYVEYYKKKYNQTDPPRRENYNIQESV